MAGALRVIRGPDNTVAFVNTGRRLYLQYRETHLRKRLIELRPSYGHMSQEDRLMRTLFGLSTDIVGVAVINSAHTVESEIVLQGKQGIAWNAIVATARGAIQKFRDEVVLFDRHALHRSDY